MIFVFSLSFGPFVAMVIITVARQPYLVIHTFSLPTGTVWSSDREVVPV